MTPTATGMLPGAYLIAYGMPRKAIRLTGKKPSAVAAARPR